MVKEKAKIEAVTAAAVEAFKRLSAEKGEGLVVYHDEADGVCAGAITSQLLESLNCKYYMVSLDKLFPRALRLVNEANFDFVVFSDIGSNLVHQITEIIGGSRNIYVFDHQNPRRAKEDSRLIHINPELFGLSGANVASGATVTYMVARLLGEAAHSLAWMAVVGAAKMPGSSGWLNWVALQDALKTGDVTREVKGRRERIVVNVFERPRSYDYLSEKLTVLSSVGYYEGGSQEAVSACVFRTLKEARCKIKALEEKRKRAFQRLIEKIGGDGLFASDRIQWLDAGDQLRGMGTKVIGSFTSYLRYQTRFLHPEKYILGFMELGDFIPGLGKIGQRMIKVSCRVPVKLQRMIEAGKREPVSALIEAAAYHNGGYGEGHIIAGSAILPGESIGTFLTSFNKLACRTA